MKTQKQDYQPAEIVVIPLESVDIICTSKEQKTITPPSGSSSGFDNEGVIDDGGILN